MTESRWLVEDELRRLAKTFGTADVETFTRPDLATLSFEAGKKTFERLVRLGRRISKMDTSVIPDERLGPIRDRLLPVFKVLQDVATFDPEKHRDDAFRVRDELLVEVAKAENTAFDQLGRILVMTDSRLERFDDELREAQERALRDVAVAAAKQKEEADRLLESLRRIEESAKTAAQEVGVARHGAVFAQIAEEHRDAAKQWLWVSIGFAVLTGIAVLLSIGSVFYYSKRLSAFTLPMAAQLAIAKLVGFSILGTATIWSGRMYRAHRHNYVVNRHRQNALNTFETFVESSRDAQTKDAVLLQATQSIFASQSTGYLSDEAEAPTTPQIIEIVRNLAGKS